MKKTLSVIIPTIGGKSRIPYLNLMLDSIFRQTIPFDEIIIFDNSGKKNVRGQVKEQYQKHPDIKWYCSDEMLPISESFRTAASYCSCDYMTIQGDDDEFYPDYAAKIHARLSEDPGIIITPFEFMDENGNDLLIYERFPLKDMPIKAFLNKELNIVFGALCFARSIYLATSGFKSFCFKGLYMDWLLFWEMGMLCKKISVIPSYVIRYRKNNQWTGTIKNLDELEKFCIGLKQSETFSRQLFLENGYSENDCRFLNDLFRSHQIVWYLRSWDLSLKDVICLCFRKYPAKLEFRFRDRFYVLRHIFQYVHRNGKEQ
ncbi:MAG: glycosyltransferase family 2 protein [Lentisphaeria bacterium]|nr:glycosyltransferase family 2 protein [Lentisphaeria bacterium]